MHTVNEIIEKQMEAFRALSISRQNKLRQAARIFANHNPHMADASNFWRGLSARHILAASCEN